VDAQRVGVGEVREGAVVCWQLARVHERRTRNDPCTHDRLATVVLLGAPLCTAHAHATSQHGHEPHGNDKHRPTLATVQHMDMDVRPVMGG
jgi:hypothetical protein